MTGRTAVSQDNCPQWCDPDAFNNLPDGAILTVGANHAQASYTGGDDNDLTLTVVP